MRTIYLSSIAALGSAILVAASSTGAPIAPHADLDAEQRQNLNGIALASEDAIKPDDASRFAKQASFGPTDELIKAIIAKKSIASWLEDQFNLSSSTYSDLASKPVPIGYCSNKTGTEQSDCTRDNFSATPMQVRFYANAIGKDDQLRQRVAFALSQIIVASDMDVRSTAGLATFNQILLTNAFGNYRDILKSVTMNPYMGDYLDMADSSATQPNENYARELMQLFSIGTILLNPDGTPQTDNTGAAIATYNNTDVKEVARALTGWTYSRFDGAAPSANSGNRDYSRPMMIYSGKFDTGAKSFLGKTIPIGASQQTNVDAVIDAVFNHPNAGPYICKRLIQQLTVPNPMPAYVERVAAVFANNGSGVRGDMKSVVRAIYLDSEARVFTQAPGKVKEPVLLITSLARAIGVTSDGYAFFTRDASMGQALFRAPSVFNFYSYDFPMPQSQGLTSPVSKLMTTSTAVARHNFVFDWTMGADNSRSEFKPTMGSGTTFNWTSWEAIGADDGKIVDRINLLMLNGTMTSAQRQALLTAMAAIKNNDSALQTRKRAQVALYIAASSPFFQVDR